MENTSQPPLTTPPPLPSEIPVNKPIRWKLWVLIASIVIAIPASILYFQILKLSLSKPIAPAPAPTATPMQTLNSTENWKTYKDPEIGFMMQYPPDFEIVDDQALSEIYRFSLNEKDVLQANRVIGFTVKNPDFDVSKSPFEGDAKMIEGALVWDMRITIGNIKGLNEKYTLKMLTDEHAKSGTLMDYGKAREGSGKIETITVDGKSGYKISNLAGLIENFIFIPSTKTNEAIFIETFIIHHSNPEDYNGNNTQPPISPRYEKNKMLFDQILSTFKFLPVSPSQDGDQAQTNNNAILNEINGFPVYPNASFIKKQKEPVCDPNQMSGFSRCNSISYLWETTDDGDKVNNWYRNDDSKSGWKCSGGAGDYTSSRDFYAKTSCRKGTVIYDLWLEADSEKTQIILVIPK